MIAWMPLGEVLVGRTSREKLEQGWSPQCEAQPAEDGHWGVLKTTAIQPGKFLEWENKNLPDKLKPRPQREVQPGDLLLTCAGPRARCGVPTYVPATRDKLILSGKMYRFRPDTEIMDPRFLQYYLLSPDAQRAIDGMKTGINESGLNLTKDRFLGLIVPVFPLDAQLRTVEVLEDHLSRIDAGVEYLKACQRRLETLNSALFDNAEELQGAPEMMLESLLTEKLTNGRSLPTADIGFPVLRLTAMQDGRIDLSERKTGNWSAEDASGVLIAKNDVFITRGNGSIRLVGRAALVAEEPDPVAFPDTMIRIRADREKVLPEYLVQAWNSRYVRRQIEATARTTAGIYKVSQKDLQKIMLRVPSREAQQALIVRLTDQNESVRRARNQVEVGLRRADRLRASLLAAAFSGRLTGAASDTEDIEQMAEALV
ncbi:UNVERIFIED_ORG: type I restriction enzyme S subunit [Arthrobacter sp. UYCu721]